MKNPDFLTTPGCVFRIVHETNMKKLIIQNRILLEFVPVLLVRLFVWPPDKVRDLLGPVPVQILVPPLALFHEWVALSFAILQLCLPHRRKKVQEGEPVKRMSTNEIGHTTTITEYTRMLSKIRARYLLVMVVSCITLSGRFYPVGFCVRVSSSHPVFFLKAKIIHMIN